MTALPANGSTPTVTGASGTAAPGLELRDVRAGYGPFRALFGVSFAIATGTATALLGTNGAGKTTVARVATGLVHPDAGQVLLDGNDVSQSRVCDLARQGVAHCVEGRSVFASLSVAENLQLLGGGRTKAERTERTEEACEMFPRLGERRSQLAGTLSGGEQRMLALAAVLVAKPRVLVADELSLGLAPVIVDEVYARLQQVKAQGTTLLIVEQHADHALALADHVVVLRHGSVSYDGPPIPLTDLASSIL